MTDTEISEIESLVGMITSTKTRDENRLKFFTQLVYDKEGDITFPVQYVDEMIDVCLRKSDELEGIFDLDQKANLLTYAARIAKCAGRTEQAQQLYERTIHFHDEIGYGLYQAQLGLFPDNAKPLKGFNGVFEIIENFDSNTYRAVYATKLGEYLYVLHAFQKKSKTGIKTPKEDVGLIRQRLQTAKIIARGE